MKRFGFRHLGLGILLCVGLVFFIGVHPTGQKSSPAADIQIVPEIQDNSGQVVYRFTSLNGDCITSETHKGKVVVLFVGASWCQPCRFLLPWLNGLWRQLQEDGVELVVVSIDADDASWQTFYNDHGCTFPTVRISPTVLPRHEPWRYVPMMILIDREGKIRKRYIGLHMQDDTIAEDARKLFMSYH